MIMFQIYYTGQFKKDLKLIKKRSAENFDSLRGVVDILESGGHFSLNVGYKKHKLSGSYSNHWECHVLPDLLLFWLQSEREKIIILVRAGSHADLF